MHSIESKNILSAKNGMNLYRVVCTAAYIAIQEAIAIISYISTFEEKRKFEQLKMF